MMKILLTFLGLRSFCAQKRAILSQILNVLLRCHEIASNDIWYQSFSGGGAMARLRPSLCRRRQKNPKINLFENYQAIESLWVIYPPQFFLDIFKFF
jgi:hypothetical protein